MAAGKIVTCGKLISAAAMTADISFALGTSLMLGLIGARNVTLKLTSAGTPDHVGVIYIRVGNDLSDTFDELQAITVASGTAVDEMLDLGRPPGKYLEVFYDRTSGGTNDTLTCTASVERK